MHVHDVTADWADLSAVPEAMSSWAHNGIAVTDAGGLIGFHAGRLVLFDGNGHVSRSVRPGLTEGHGITLVREGDEEYLWVSDPGFVFKIGPDAEDAFVGYAGASDSARNGAGWPERPGWPNALGSGGRVERAHPPAADEFNSPHSLAVDADGNLYVSEWLIGGRYTKFRLVAQLRSQAVFENLHGGVGQ